MISTDAIGAFGDELAKIAGLQRYIKPLRKKLMGVQAKQEVHERERKAAERADVVRLIREAVRQ